MQRYSSQQGGYFNVGLTDATKRKWADKWSNLKNKSSNFSSGLKNKWSDYKANRELSQRKNVYGKAYDLSNRGSYDKNREDQIQRMLREQSGGRHKKSHHKKRSSRKSKKSGRKSKKSGRKSKKSGRKSRKSKKSGRKSRKSEKSGRKH